LLAHSVAWPLPDNLKEEELDQLLFRSVPVSGTKRPLPDWDYIRKELSRPGVTLFLLWEEYQAHYKNACGRSQFYVHYRRWKSQIEPSMRIEHKAGDKLFVDYAGQTAAVIDPETGERHEAQIFVATMGASSCTYAEATWTQSLPDWIGAHVRAFAFFGGVTRLLVPDNLKSGVTAACHYEPGINETYARMAAHYGVAVLPARVRHPKTSPRLNQAYWW